MAEIKYEELSADKKIKDLVKRIWKLQNVTDQAKHTTILPDGYFDLILTIQGNRKSVLLTGIYSEEFEVTIPANTTLIGISFLPLAAEYIFEQSISMILNRYEIMPIDFWGLNKIDHEDFESWAKQVTNQIHIQQKTKKDIDSRKTELFNILFHSKGCLKVAEISKLVFWSSRQINRYFKNNFGLSLKAYCTILRCKATYNGIKKGDLYPLDNFTDQAHFITDIKKHTGVTPKVLAKNKNDRFIQFSTRPTD
jgi:AraC-like DNA-binding protein